MKERIAGISVLANFILAVSKVLIGIITNSASVLAEGVHSGMDIFSSAISLIGIKISKKPVDERHPYGYYKFEVLSGLVITIILFATGLGIIYEAYQNFLSPSVVSVGSLSLGVMIFSAIVNETMARLKIYYGKKENSVSLLSDGVHSRVDVYTSIAVLLGLLITPYWNYADSIMALLIGLYIIKESFEIGKEATDSLLDVSAGEEVENKIKKIVKDEKIELEELKTQKKGSVITANLVIKLPSNLSVEKATKISNALKEKLMEKIDGLGYVAIQIKSHEVIDSSFAPLEVSSIGGFGFGRGFGWQRRGKMKTQIPEAVGAGPGGYCVCENCGYKVKHQRGVPCSTLKCPKCGGKMRRE